MRRHYIDNIRTIIILLLIPYHAAMAFNTWGEPNYIMLEESRVLSSFITFCSPFFMPVLFVLAGMSTRFAMRKRTPGEYLKERLMRLFVPMLFGTAVLMPVMTYLAARHNYSYKGTFLAHAGYFFTTVTDLTGADGAFSFGQFWFLLFLFVISYVALLIILLSRRISRKPHSPDTFSFTPPLWLVILLGLPLALLNNLLEVGGKSILAYLYLFLLGYYIFANEAVMAEFARFVTLLLPLGVLVSVANVYLFIWSPERHELLNEITNFAAEWLMILATLGAGKRWLDRSNSTSKNMARKSFAFFSLHFIFVVLFQYLFGGFILPVSLAYAATLLAVEVFTRVPGLSVLLGVKGSDAGNSAKCSVSERKTE